MADTKISALTNMTNPATTDELAINDGGVSKAITFEALTKRNQVVPCTLTVPEGSVAFPDVHALATASSKVTGIVLPDGAATSTLNFKCVIPEDLHGTPAMAGRIRFMTQTADTAHAVRLTLSTVGIAINENLDTALTAETEVTAECADATETMNEAEVLIDLTTDWAAGDTIIGQLKRDPTDAVDDYAGDILVVGIELLMDTVGSA